VPAANADGIGPTEEDVTLETSRGYGRYVLLTMVVSIAQCLIGCGLTTDQRKAVTTFASSASDLGTASGDEFSKMQGTAVKLNTALYSGRDPTLSQEIKQGSYRNLYGNFTPDRMALRIKLAQNLQEFGTLLNQLATTSETEQLTTAAGSLSASLKSLPPDLKFVSDNNADAIEKVVEEVGGILVEYKRKNAIKSVIDLYNPQIVGACKLIHDDFDISRPHLGEQMNLINGRLLQSTISALREQPDNVGIRPEEITNYALAFQTKAHIDTVYSSIVKSSDKCVSADQALIKGMSSNEFSPGDITAFEAEVKELIAALRSFK
jgi:hypothetical protein